MPPPPLSTRRRTLSLSALSVTDLKPGGWNGLSDPFVTVRFGSCLARTSTQEQTLNPKWDETLHLGTHSLARLFQTALVLGVYDENKGRVREGLSATDDFLGEARVPLSGLAKLEHAENQHFTLPLPQGSISFAVNFAVGSSSPEGVPDAAAPAAVEVLPTIDAAPRTDVQDTSVPTDVPTDVRTDVAQGDR